LQATSPASLMGGITIRREPLLVCKDPVAPEVSFKFRAARAVRSITAIRFVRRLSDQWIVERGHLVHSFKSVGNGERRTFCELDTHGLLRWFHAAGVRVIRVTPVRPVGT